MLGHAAFYGKTPYHQQSVINNVSLLTEEISSVVVTCSHRLARNGRKIIRFAAGKIRL